MVPDTTGATGVENGYGYVDLGLSVRWATANVGAAQPYDSGLYFAWGDTTGYTSYIFDGHSLEWANSRTAGRGCRKDKGRDESMIRSQDVRYTSRL